jgi:hypothetical protein
MTPPLKSPRSDLPISDIIINMWQSTKIINFDDINSADDDILGLGYIDDYTVSLRAMALRRPYVKRLARPEKE